MSERDEEKKKGRVGRLVRSFMMNGVYTLKIALDTHVKTEKHGKRRKSPATVNCRGIKNTAVVNCRGKLQQLTVEET